MDALHSASDVQFFLCHAAFGKWRPWLECYLSNPSLRHLSCTVPAFGSLELLASCPWEQLAVLLQRLYSKKSRKVCNDAARRLHSCVFARAEVEVESRVQGEIPMVHLSHTAACTVWAVAP